MATGTAKKTAKQAGWASRGLTGPARCRATGSHHVVAHQHRSDLAKAIAGLDVRHPPLVV